MSPSGKKTSTIPLFNDGTFILILVGVALVMAVAYSFLSPAPEFEVKADQAARSGGKKTPPKKTPKKAPPIKYAKKTISKSYPFDLRKPHFVLNQLKQIAASGDSKGDVMKKLWKGPDDLMVKSWVGVDDKYLHMRFEITDDIPNYSDVPNDMWRKDSIQIAIWHPGFKSQYEFGVGIDNNNTRTRALWMVPPKYSKEKTAFLNAIDFEVTRKNEKTLVYDVELPYKMLHLTRKQLAGGLRYSFIVNDADAEGDSRYWMELSPGIGQHKKKEYFPLIKLP